MISKELSQYLSQLRTLLESNRVEGLSDRYYEIAHQKFESVSNQRGQIAKAIGQLIGRAKSNGANEVSWLSVGCGAGHLDIPLLREGHDGIDCYVGLDPNAKQLDIFRASAPQSSNLTLLNSRLEDWVVTSRFNLITAVHVLYYTADPRKFVRKLMAAKAEVGICLVAVAPLSPMNRIAEIFWKEQFIQPMFADDLAELCTDLDLRFERKRLEASVPLAHLVGSSADRAVIDFTVQAKTDDLSYDAKKCLEATFEIAAIEQNEERVLEHPVDLFLI